MRLSSASAEFRIFLLLSKARSPWISGFFFGWKCCIKECFTSQVIETARTQNRDTLSPPFRHSLEQGSTNECICPIFSGFVATPGQMDRTASVFCERFAAPLLALLKILVRHIESARSSEKGRPGALFIFRLFVKSWGEKDSQPVKCGHGSWRNCESQRQRASEL